MDGVRGMVSVKSAVIVVGMAVVLAAAIFGSQTLLTTPQLDSGTEINAAPVVEVVPAGEVELAVEGGDTVSGGPMSARRDWLPAEIGTGSSVTITSNGGFAPGEDYMNLGRSLEQAGDDGSPSMMVPASEAAQGADLLEHDLKAIWRAGVEAAAGGSEETEGCVPRSIIGPQPC